MAIEPIYGMYVHDEETDTDGVAKFSSEELEDIRVGADGTTYSNAGDAVRGQVNAISDITGKVLYSGYHSYAGGAENWRTFVVPDIQSIAIRIFPVNGQSFEIAMFVNERWSVVDTISDDDWHIIQVPANTTDKLIVTYRGTDPVTISCVVTAGSYNLVTDVAGLVPDVVDLENITNNAVDNIPKKLVDYKYTGYIDTSGTVVENTDFFYTDFIDVKKLFVNVNIYWHSDVATFTFYDAQKNYLNEYIKRNETGNGMAKKLLDIPNDAVYVRVCTDPTYNNEVFVYDVPVSDVGSEDYGNYGKYVTYYANFNNFSACPCKKAEKSGKVTSLYVNSETAGTTTIYVGDVDQLYLFVPRASFSIDVVAGVQTIDVSHKDIYINEGETILYKFIGKASFVRVNGEPEGDDSFYYSETGGMQLAVYGAQYSAVFGFGYEVESSIDYEQNAQIIENTTNIATAQGDISILQMNQNVVSDRNGNKYKMIVTNGNLSLLPLDFNHVLCVGNSYTVHPTTTDTETDYRNNLWWGHWAMASTTKETAWTTLLQNALRQKNANAVVTPVFGRRYETSYTTYHVDNPNTFTYWDGTAWQSLKNNVASFSDVDAVVFFLGANYSGDDWYTLYSDMVEQFLEWFPNASLFCCSSTYSANAVKDGDIQRVANEWQATYISMVGTGARSKIGSFVKGDDNLLHQINNSAVGNHYGDYGEYLINDRVCKAMGYNNNTPLYNISVSSNANVSLSVISGKTIAGSVITIFATYVQGATFNVSAKDSNNNNIAVTDHGETDYGRVFTFEMPTSDVTVNVNLLTNTLSYNHIKGA